jgi:hypothetical protein
MASQPDIIADWLTEEAKADPECQVLAAITTATRAGVLDEAGLLAKLRVQCEPPNPEEKSGNGTG